MAGYGEYTITPPNILGALDFVDRRQQRRAEAQRDQLALEMARRKMAMEQQAGQIMGGLFKVGPGATIGDVDENALARLMAVDPTRGLAVVNWLASRQDRELNRRLIEARIGKITGTAGGGPGGVSSSPWAPLPAGGGSAPAATGAPRMGAPAGAPAGLPTPDLGSVGQRVSWDVPVTPPGTQYAGAPQFADTTGGEPPGPTGGSGGDGDLPPGSPLAVDPGGNLRLAPPPAQAPVRPGARPGGPGTYGLPVDIYDARSRGYVAVLDPKGKPQVENGYMAMHVPGQPGSGIFVPFKQDVEPRESAPAGYRAAQGGGLEPIPGGPADPNVAKRQNAPAGYRFTTDGNLEAIPGGPGAKLSESQAKDFTYALRLARAIPEFEKMAYGGERPSQVERVFNEPPTIFGMPLIPGAKSIQSTVAPRSAELAQRFDQISRDMINAMLRRESGAVISPSEFENAYKQYIPQPGDTDTTVRQKLQNLRTQLQAFAIASGRPETFGIGQNPTSAPPAVMPSPAERGAAALGSAVGTMTGGGRKPSADDLKRKYGLE